MEFNELKYFIRWKTQLNVSYKPIQIIIIKKLLENNGDLNIASINQYQSEDRGYNKYVLDLLVKHKIIKIDDNNVRLIDYENYNPSQKRILLNLCEHYKNNSNNITSSYILSLRDEFTYWLNNYSKINIKDHINSNKIQIEEIMKNIGAYDISKYQIFGNVLIPTDISDFDNNKFSSEHSIQLFSMLQDIVDNGNVEKFIAAYKESSINDNNKMLEFITTALFFINDSYPIANKKMDFMYDNMKKLFDLPNRLSNNVRDYTNNIICWSDLLKKIECKDIQNIQTLQIYCYWLYTFIYKNINPVSNNWHALNIPDYIRYYQDNHNNSIKYTGFVILLDALGTRDSSRTGTYSTRDKIWSDLIKNLPNYFINLDDVSSIVNFSYFSDTIMITYGIPDCRFSTKILNSIGSTLGRFMVKSINEKIFFRGCVSFGEYYYNKSGMSGNAVNEVGDYHRLPNWIGISATPSLYIKLLNSESNCPESFVHYLLPTKNGVEPNYVLDLKSAFEKSSSSKPLIDILKNELEQCRILKPDASLKYRNTIEFIKY